MLVLWTWQICIVLFPDIHVVHAYSCPYPKVLDVRAFFRLLHVIASRSARPLRTCSIVPRARDLDASPVLPELRLRTSHSSRLCAFNWFSEDHDPTASSCKLCQFAHQLRCLHQTWSPENEDAAENLIRLRLCRQLYLREPEFALIRFSICSQAELNRDGASESMVLVNVWTDGFTSLSAP